MRAVLPALAALSAVPAFGQWFVDPADNVPVSTAASDQNQPLVEFGSVGGHWVSWLDGIGSGWDVRLQYFGISGCAEFGEEGLLVADRSFSSTQGYGLDVAPNGDALLTYRDDSTGSIEIALTRVDPFGEILWTTAITAGAGFVAAPKVAALEDDTCVVAWTEDNGVRTMRVDAGGVRLWTTPAILAPSAGSYAVADLHGGLGTDSILSIVHTTGGFSSPRHLLAQRFSGLGATLWGLNPVPVFDGGSLQFGNFPAFVPDGAGGAVFAWYSSSPSLECFVQRLNASGTELFPHNGVAVSTGTGGARVDPHIVFSRFPGEVAVAWEEQNASQSMSGISLQCLDASGNRLLGDQGATVVPLSPSDTSSARVMAHDPGNLGTIVAWEDSQSPGNDRVYSAIVDPSGALSGGVEDLASTPSGKGRYASPVNAVYGSWLVWSDARSDGGDIYAQPVRSPSAGGPPFIGSQFCTPNPNSVGPGALMYALGSRDVASNGFWLLAEQLPPNQFGIFVVSTDWSTSIPINQGNICLVGTIGRFMAPGQILNSGTDGEFCLRVNLTQIPQAATLVPVQPGSTWYFQAWYRDVNPTPTSNFTSGFEVTFQ